MLNLLGSVNTAPVPARVAKCPCNASAISEQLGRALDELAAIVHPNTLRRWLRERKGKRSAKTNSAGRAQSFTDLRKLIVKMARENPGWGYTQIMGELKRLNLTPPSRSTIRNILREHGLEPAPNRGDSTWDEFLKLHAATLWQADVLIFGQKHLDFLTRIFERFYHSLRPHQSKDNQVFSLQPPPRRRKRKHPRPAVAPTTTISLAEVKCERQLGRLLKHYHRKAA